MENNRIIEAIKSSWESLAASETIFPMWEIIDVEWGTDTKLFISLTQDTKLARLGLKRNDRLLLVADVMEKLGLGEQTYSEVISVLENGDRMKIIQYLVTAINRRLIQNKWPSVRYKIIGMDGSGFTNSGYPILDAKI